MTAHGYVKMNIYIVPVLVVVCLAVGWLSIASACYHWVWNRLFGLAGVVLSIVGLSLLGASLGVFVLYAARLPDPPKPSDTTAIQRQIDDSDAKIVAAIRDSNKQLADQLQQFAKKNTDNEQRVLSEIQSHILAIRTALTERSVPQPRTDAESSSTRPKQKTPKAR